MRLRAHAQKRRGTGGAGPVQPDRAVRRHHLPVREEGHPREHLQHDERPVQLLQPRHQRPGDHHQRAGPARGDRQQDVLPQVGPLPGPLRRGIQPHPQRQDARRRLQPQEAPLPHLHHRGGGYRLRDPEAGAHAQRLRPGPRQDQEQGRAHRRTREAQGHQGPAEPVGRLRVRLGQFVPVPHRAHGRLRRPPCPWTSGQTDEATLSRPTTPGAA